VQLNIVNRNPGSSFSIASACHLAMEPPSISKAIFNRVSTYWRISKPL